MSTTTAPPVRYYSFKTRHGGIVRSYEILGTSVRDAVTTLRAALYDDETIVGWA